LTLSLSLETEISEAESDFVVAKISLRVLLWVDVDAFPEKWTIENINASSPNTIQLPGQAPELALIIAQV